jgi:hypothetical protein
MYQCKFTCSFCTNFVVKDDSPTPEHWFKIEVWTPGSSYLTLLACPQCLPKPVYKSSIESLFPMLRKKVANWWSER